MVESWEVNEVQDLVLFAEEGRVLNKIERAKIDGGNWEQTRDNARKWVSDQMAEAIADHFYFRSDDDIIAFLEA